MKIRMLSVGQFDIVADRIAKLAKNDEQRKLLESAFEMMRKGLFD